jgi:hypothetical protein
MNFDEMIEDSINKRILELVGKRHFELKIINDINDEVKLIQNNVLSTYDKMKALNSEIQTGQSDLYRLIKKNVEEEYKKLYESSNVKTYVETLLRKEINKAIRDYLEELEFTSTIKSEVFGGPQ